ncbi:MAG: hypothetical protein SVR94_07105 [Pseudomonadota bacterium]|nr:hypothetical protein [Pseudomonadota bacterium]
MRGQQQRKTIGSVDYEAGYRWNVELHNIHLRRDLSTSTTNLFGDVNWLTPVIVPHNIVQVQAAAGQTWGDFISAGRFYFEGFDNQLLEEETQHRYRQLESLERTAESQRVLRN